MYCFILLFNLFSSSMTDLTVIGSGTLILCNVQFTMLERFSAIWLHAMQHNINWKMQKYEYFWKIKKIQFK